MFEALVGIMKRVLTKKSSAKNTIDADETSENKLIDNDHDRIDDRLEETIQVAGYSYDELQDIFYSNMEAWQRDMGYCSLFDEASVPLGMVVDCEPIYFEYGGKRWLIEFWKGQYDLTTGCEIGIYTTDKADIDIPGIFAGPFFHSASDTDRLQMSLTLFKNGKKLFTREDKHWWLTGFKLGEFSEPWELVMDLSITLKDDGMRNAFIKGLKNTGYRENEITVKENTNTVSVKYKRPKSPQPASRTIEAEWIIQRKNQLLCKKYQEITGPYNKFPDKLEAIKKKSPQLYEKVININKTKQLFGKLEKLIGYLNL